MEAPTSLAARAAWLQLIDGRTSIEVAQMLSVSRLQIPKLVRWAETHDVATVSIRPPSGLNWDLSDRLRSRYGIVEALVSSELSLQSAARLAARYVSEVLNEGGVFGIAWGRGTQAIVGELERMAGVPRADVVQLIGGLPGSKTTWHSSELLGRLAVVMGASAAGLLSPMIVEDAATAQGLMREPSIAHAFQLMEQINVAVFGIGAWVEDGSRVHDELNATERAGAANVIADICGVLLDASGTSVHPELTDRIISVGENTLRACPVRLGIAVSVARAHAIDAALRSGLVTVLCTDAATASAILKIGD